MTAIDIDAVEREYLAGATTYELGEKYGVNFATVSKWMRKRGHWRGKGYGQKPTVKTCAKCGAVFVASQKKQIYCSKVCCDRAKWLKRDSNTHSKRAKKYGVPYEKGITLKKVFERDGGICQICGEPCDCDAKLPNGGVGNDYPSIDHIIPMHKGGGHTWNNVQLAHMRCNSIKGESMGVIAHAEKQTA